MRKEMIDALGIVTEMAWQFSMKERDQYGNVIAHSELSELWLKLDKICCDFDIDCTDYMFQVEDILREGATK